MGEPYCLYSREIMEHFKHPKGLGKLKNPSAVGKAGNLVCGDVLWCYIKVKKDKKGRKIIENVKMEVFGCLPPDEEVVIREGDWAKISSISMGLPVLNEMGKKTYVSDINVRNYKGTLLRIVPFVSPYNSFSITPEHPILCVKRNWFKSARKSSGNCDWLRLNEKELLSVKPEYVEAKNLEIGDYLVFVPNKKIKDNPIITKDVMRLLGYYLAEGYTSAKGSVVAFAFNKNERKAVSEVKRLIRRLTEKEPRERIRKNVSEVYVCSRKLAKFLCSFCGRLARHKKLADEIITLPFKKQWEMIETYFLGDGYSCKRRPNDSPTYKICTVSRSLAIQTQEILARGDIFSSLKLYSRPEHLIEGRKIRKYSFYEISFKLKRRHKFFHHKRKYFLVPIKKIEKSHFDGKVYNFEVEKEPHSYLVKGFAVHNCVVAIANTSMLTTMVKGKTLDEALKINKDALLKKLGKVPPIKIHCSVLAADALHEAIYNYYLKNKLTVPKDLQKEHEKIQRALKTIEERHEEFVKLERNVLKGK